MSLNKVKVALSLGLVLALLAGGGLFVSRGPAAAPPVFGPVARAPVPVAPPAEKVKKAKVALLKKYRARDQNVEAGFVPHKTEVAEGEPIRVAFTVKNLSDKPFLFWVGGDYRATGRHDRFKIGARDANGVSLIDPRAWRRNGPGGGIGGCQGPAPGGTHRIDVDLTRYRTFPGTGTYTITCRFDLEVPEEGRIGGRCVVVPVETTWELTILPRSAENLRRGLRYLVEQAKQGDERNRAMFRLVSFGREWALPELAALAKEGEREQRVAALFALGNFPMAPSDDSSRLVWEDDEAVRVMSDARSTLKIDTTLAALLARSPREKSVPLRCCLLVALGNTGSPRALAPLEEALRDRSPAVRRAAVRGLVLCGGPRALRALERCALEDLPVREAVVCGLVGAHRQPLRPEWLLPAIRAGRGRLGRETEANWALDLLRNQGGKDAAASMIVCLDFRDPSPAGRYNAELMRHLAGTPGAPKVKWPQSVEENRRTLAELRAWLSRHERGRPVPEKITKLIRRLGSETFAEREKASRALEALGPPVFEPLLRTSALSDDLETSRRADRAIEALLRRWSGP